MSKPKPTETTSTYVVHGAGDCALSLSVTENEFRELQRVSVDDTEFEGDALDELVEVMAPIVTAGRRRKKAQKTKDAARGGAKK